MGLKQLILPVVLAVGAESTREMTTKEHFQDLGQVVKDGYKQRIESGSSVVSAALKAGAEGLAYDATTTGLKWLRAGLDFADNFRGREAEYVPMSDYQPVAAMVVDQRDRY